MDVIEALKQQIGDSKYQPNSITLYLPKQRLPRKMKKKGNSPKYIFIKGVGKVYGGEPIEVICN